MSQLLGSDISRQDESAKELVDMIENQAKETLNLLGTLFDWAKSQTGQITFNPECINLYATVRRVTEHLGPTAVIKNISIENLCSGDLLVYADTNMLETVLRNLINNAIKFTKEGGLIRITDEKLSDQQVEITVKDNGIGMDVAMQSRLFKVNSAHTTHGTNNEKGTGLGLILCKEFIEKHGGTIHVISAPGIGSNFIFSLPVYDVSLVTA